MKAPKFTLDSPEVQAILAGVYRSGSQSYFTISENGTHVAQPIRKRLQTLMCAGTATRLLQTAEIPELPFIHNRTAVKPRPVAERETLTEIEAEVELYESVPMALEVPREPGIDQASKAAAPVKPLKKKGPRPLTEDEREAKLAKVEAAQNSKRFQYIITTSRRNGASPKHGVWDGIAGAVISLFNTKQEAIAEMVRLKTGR